MAKKSSKKKKQVKKVTGNKTAQTKKNAPIDLSNASTSGTKEKSKNKKKNKQTSSSKKSAKNVDTTAKGKTNKKKTSNTAKKSTSSAKKKGNVTKAKKKEQVEVVEEKSVSWDQRVFSYFDESWEKISKKASTIRKNVGEKLTKISDSVSEWFHELNDALGEFFRSSLWEGLAKTFRSIFIGVSVLIIICAVIIGSLNWYYSDKILPNVYIAGIPVSSMDVENAKALVQNKVSEFEDESFRFSFGEKEYKLTFADLLINTEFDKSFGNAYEWGHTADHLINQQHLISSFYTKREIPIVFDYDMGIMEQQLEMFVTEISTPPLNARIVTTDTGEFAMVPSTTSTTTDFTVAYDGVIHQLGSLQAATIALPNVTAYPTINDEMGGKTLDYANTLKSKTITFVYDENHKSIVPYTISIGEDLSWLIFGESEEGISVALDPNRLQELLSNDIIPQINQEHHNATIVLPEQEGVEYATLDSMPQDGFFLQTDETFQNIQLALHDDIIEESLVALSVEYEKGLILDQEGKDVGLTDLLGIGKSNFSGSSGARIFNIEKGLGLYNNMILSPGDEFSFNEILGAVTYANGWKAELAIFAGGHETRPVAGGGLCQVSTTMYRAAIESGLSVVERRPHSYLVSYYVKDSDPRTGVDATIYPGSQDLRFVNDTPGMILIQTHTAGNDAFIKFYGTDDGREVVLDGPYKSGWFGAGSPVLTQTTDLPPGEVKITANAHTGRTITWYQTIKYADGTENSITINSNYKAIPAKGLIGVAAL